MTLRPLDAPDSGHDGEARRRPPAATACTTDHAELGEGLRWDAVRNELLHVDIVAGTVWRHHIDEHGALVPVVRYDLPMTVGTIAPVVDDNGWLLGAGRDIVHLASDGSHRTLAVVSSPGTRMNDGACDAQGRFWVGTLADDHRAGGGALYRMGRDGEVVLVLDGLTISNGLGWSIDGHTMYLVDSGPRVVYAFDFDGATGSISARRVLVTIPAELGAPDGMTVDAAGDLWVAIYGGGCVHRYSPGGELRQVVEVPARQSTSCALVGRLGLLYVTTATEGWTDEQRSDDPTAGLLYRLDVDAVGLPALPFRPEPHWWATVTHG